MFIIPVFFSCIVCDDISVHLQDDTVKTVRETFFKVPRTVFHRKKEALNSSLPALSLPS